MTDDEAFVRRIVASPGDDLPRLVYADWLDERDDPRGAYLRAEAEWKGAEDIKSRAQSWLRRNRIDPVWRLRVSRPPLGVCCERLRFEDTGPTLTPADLE